MLPVDNSPVNSRRETREAAIASSQQIPFRKFSKTSISFKVKRHVKVRSNVKMAPSALLAAETALTNNSCKNKPIQNAFQTGLAVGWQKTVLPLVLTGLNRLTKTPAGKN